MPALSSSRHSSSAPSSSKPPGVKSLLFTLADTCRPGASSWMPNITNTMLAKLLRELEAAGLVSRHNYGTVPPKVDYSLTDDGEALLPILNELYRWGEAHMRTSQEA